VIVRRKPEPQEEPQEQDVMKAVDDRFQRLDILPIPRPVDADGAHLNPRLPSDLTVLNDIQLARLYSEFCAMAQYVQRHMARLDVERADTKRLEKTMRARVRLEKSGQVGDKDAKVEVDPKTVEAAFKAQVAYGTSVLTEAVMEGYILGKDACSREQTRRQSAFDKDRR
jgi:hypothetical protein